MLALVVSRTIIVGIWVAFFYVRVPATTRANRGSIRVPLHEWTHVAVSYDGVNEAHFMNSQQVEATACGDGGDLAVSEADFRIGGRDRGHGNLAGQTMGHDQFIGDIDVRCCTHVCHHAVV